MSYSVLIVDDDEGTRMLLRFMLGRSGFSVREAENGHQALQQVHQSRPDVMLLDVMMPGMNGIDVCQALGHDGLDFPIIMLSAKAEAWAALASLRAGAAVYLIKPVIRQVLVETIDKALGVPHWWSNGNGYQKPGLLAGDTTRSDAGHRLPLGEVPGP